MSEELGAINFKADTTDLVRAEVALTKLADAGPKVERAIDGVEKAAAKTGRSLKSLGEGSGRSLDDVGRSAPQAADGIGRVARSADDAKRSLAGMRDSAAGLSGVSSAAAQAAQGLRASATSVQEMQAAVRAATVTAQSLAAEMARVVPSVQAVIKAQADASKAALEMGLSFKTAGDQIKGFGTAAQQAAGQSREGADGVKSLADASGGLSANMGLAVRGIQAFLALQVVNWAKDSAVALYDASAAAERLRIGLDFSSVRGSAAEIAYLRKTTFDLGLAFDSTAKAYQQFSAAARGTALEGEKSRAIFEAVAKASAVMGLSAENTSGVLLALQQMISKGTVQSEELRGQLGERLPGAFQTAARAMGVTTAELGKLLEQGKVVAEDFLPKFARELESSLGGAAEKAANRLDAAVNRFNTAWEKLKQTAGDSGVSQALAKEMNAIGRDMTAISDAIENSSKRGSGALEALGTGAAVAAGRAGFASLNLVANALNGTINTLTGGVLGLRTDLALLPDSLRTNAEQLAILQAKSKDAEENLSHLQSLGGQFGKETWYKNEVERARAVAEEYRAALGQKKALMGVEEAPTGGINIGAFPSRGSHANYERERAEAEKGVLAISARQNGVTKQFLSDLAAVEKAFATGVYGTGAEAAKTYAAEVTKLNIARYESTKEGKEAAKAAKAGASAAHEEESTYARLVATINAKIAANDAELFAGGRLSDSEKLRIQLQAQLEAGSKKMSAAHKAEALRLLEKLKSQEQEEKAIKRAITLNDQQLAMRQEQAEAEAEMQRRVDAVRMSLHSYTESVKDSVEMTELELRTIGMTNSERTVLIEQLRIEQDLRKRIQEIQNAPYQSQEARQADIDKATEAALQAKLNAQRRVFVSEWDKTSQMVSDTLTDYIMRGGENAAEYLKRLFSTLVLQPVVQAVVGGLIGGGGAGGAAATSLLGSGASGLVSNLLFGGMSLTTVGSSIGAGIMATLTGSTLGGAGAAGILAGGSSALGMFGGALPYLGAGLALISLIKSFDKSGTPHYGADAVYSGGETTAVKRREDGALGYYEGAKYWNQGAQDFVNGVAKSVGGMLDSFAKSFGRETGYIVKTGFADDSSKDGAWGALQIVGPDGKTIVDWSKDQNNKWAPREFADGEAGQKQYLDMIAKDVAAAMSKTLGDADWATKALESVKDLDSLNAVLQQIGAVKAAFDGWAKTLTGFADITGKAQTELLKFAGGIEALTNNINAFYAGFYSEAERAEILQRQVREQLKGLGVDIDPKDGEAAKKAFRKLIEDALASGNTELAAKLLALAQLFGVAADAAQKSAEVAADAAKKAADEAQAAAEEMARVLAEERQKAKDAAMANFEAAVAREQEYWQGIVSSSQEAINSLSSALNTLKSNARDLYGSVDATKQMLAAQGMVYIEEALAGVRAGAKLSNYGGLSDAISAARGGISSGVYATQFERDRDALVLAGQLSDLADKGDAQLSVEERQLKNSQEQLERLDKTLTYWRDLLEGNEKHIDATLSVEAAIQALKALMFPEQPAGTGSKPGKGGGLGSDVTPGPGKNLHGDSGSSEYKHVYTNPDGSAYYASVTAKDRVDRLNSLKDGYHAFDGTGNAAGLYDWARQNNATPQDLAELSGLKQSDWEAWLANQRMPSYDVGTNRVPFDMVARIHKDEAIIPAPFNPWAGGAMPSSSGSARSDAVLERLLSAVERLDARVTEVAERVTVLQEQTDSVTEGGNAMRTEVMNVTALAQAIAKEMA